MSCDVNPPPRIVFATAAGMKRGSLRAIAMLPKRICVWVASGLSTRSTRRAVIRSGGGVRAGTASGRARERRIEEDLAHEVEAGSEVLGEELRADDRAVRPGGGADPTAERLDRARELVGAELPGALRERARDQCGRALLAGGILRRTRA